MTTIYLIRHAEPDRSVEDEMTRPLTARGKEQVAQVTAYLKDKDIQAIYSSDYLRTLDTIRGFSQYSGLPIHTDARLREGILGCPREARVVESMKQWQDLDYCLPAGESIRQLQNRMCQCLKEILRDHQGEAVAVCTHGTAMSAVLNYYRPSFGWEEAKKVKQVWPWLLRFTFEDQGQFVACEETRW